MEHASRCAKCRTPLTKTSIARYTEPVARLWVCAMCGNQTYVEVSAAEAPTMQEQALLALGRLYARALQAYNEAFGAAARGGSNQALHTASNRAFTELESARVALLEAAANLPSTFPGAPP